MAAQENNNILYEEYAKKVYISEIKALRENLHNKIERIKNYNNTKELDIVITKLTEARMWLGQELNRIWLLNKADKHPYANGNNINNTIIDPPADAGYGSDYDLDKSKLPTP